MSDDPNCLTFTYANYKDEISVRHVYPMRIYFGYSEYYRRAGWLLRAYDLDKQGHRDFLMERMNPPVTQYVVDAAQTVQDAPPEPIAPLVGDR